MEWADKFIVREEGLAWRVLEGLAIVINPRDNMLYPLNAVGSRLWELADGSQTLGEITAALLDEFEVERQVLETDLQEFAGQMAEKRLIKVSSEAILKKETQKNV